MRPQSNRASKDLCNKCFGLLLSFLGNIIRINIICAMVSMSAMFLERLFGDFSFQTPIYPKYFSRLFEFMLHLFLYSYIFLHLLCVDIVYDRTRS